MARACVQVPRVQKMRHFAFSFRNPLSELHAQKVSLLNSQDIVVQWVACESDLLLFVPLSCLQLSCYSAWAL